MAAKKLQQLVQGEAYQLVFRQLAGVVLLAFLALILSGMKSGYSVLAGGLAYGIPNLIFVWRVFRYSGASQMNKFMVAFYFGEMIKLFLSGILFLMIVKYLAVSLLSTLVGFGGAIVSFWIACLIHFSREKKGVAR